MHPYLHLGPLEIPTYFLLISLVCTLGVFLLPWWAKKFQMPEARTTEIYLLVLLSGFVGARLFHVIFEEWEHYRHNPIEAFYFWNGGFVYLGSVVMATLIARWYLKQKEENFWLWADVFAPWMAFGYGVGRLGCFLNGCCYGKVCHLPWAVTFPSHKNLIEPWIPRHPTQLYAFGSEMILFLALAGVMWVRREKIASPRYQPGRFFLAWLFFHGIFRLINEHFRDDDRGMEILGMSLSSFISLLLIGVGFWGFVLVKGRRPTER